MIYKGVSYPSVAALARATGVSYKLLQDRLWRGWPLIDAVERERIDPATSGRMGKEVSSWNSKPLFPKRKKV